jgi:TRAP-type C4-dicarboxylate transport system substrate-binding protein
VGRLLVRRQRQDLEGRAPDVQNVIAKHINAAAKKQRDDIAKANVDLQKTLEGKGLAFNKVDNAAFRKALRDAGFYKEVRDRFDKEAWALLTAVRR